VPQAVRAQVWEIRRDGIHPVTRNWLARIRVLAGRPVACVDIEGFRLYVDLRDKDGVGRPIYCRAKYEPSETTVVCGALQRGMTVVDIGANIGYFTVLAARLVEERGRVLAFEPDPHNFALLTKSICANRLRNVTALNMALGAESGSARLYRSHSNFGDHRLYSDPKSAGRSSEEVPVDTLDNVLAAHRAAKVDFIKMDVQGYEHSVLRGMAATLAANPGIQVLTEFWPLGIERAGGSPVEFFRTLEAAGLSATLTGPAGTLIPTYLDDVMQRVAGKFSEDAPDGAFVNLFFQKAEVPMA
jgi:FkbM family methyltransferase